MNRSWICHTTWNQLTKPCWPFIAGADQEALRESYNITLFPIRNDPNSFVILLIDAPDSCFKSNNHGPVICIWSICWDIMYLSRRNSAHHGFRPLRLIWPDWTAAIITLSSETGMKAPVNRLDLQACDTTLLTQIIEQSQHCCCRGFFHHFKPDFKFLKSSES